MQDRLLLRRVRIDLEVRPQRVDGDLAVAGVDRGLGELLQVRRVPGLELRRPLVGRDGVRVGAGRLLVEQGRPGRCGLRGVGVGRVRADRRPERAAGQEGRARIRELRRRLGALELRRVLVPLGQLEAAEQAPGGCVLVLHGEILLSAPIARAGVARLLVGGGEVVVLRGILLGRGLSLGDAGAAAPAEDAVVELREAAAVAGADADEDEAQPEDHGEHGVDPLLVAPQADEEELLVRVAAALVPTTAPARRLRRLAPAPPPAASP